MKQWISLLGEAYTSPQPADGATPPDPAPEYEKKNDTRLEGPIFDGQVMEHVVTLAGSRAKLVELDSMVVHGFRYGVRAYVMRSRLTAAVAMQSASQSALVPGGANEYGALGATSINIRIVFDIPGDDEREAMNSGDFYNAPTPTMRLVKSGPYDSGQVSWQGVAAGWSWDTTNNGFPRAYFAGYQPKNALPAGDDGPVDGYARGTFSRELVSTNLPFGLVRATGDVLSLGEWGGGVGTISDFDAYGLPDASGYLQFTKLELLVSEKPTWEVTTPTSLTVDADGDDLIEFVATYPVGNEPAAGVKVALSDATECVSFQNAFGQWSHSATFTTDNNGEFQCRVRAEKGGTAQVKIRDGNNLVNMTYLFSPPLKATTSVLTIEAEDPEEPPPPPPDDPAVDTECTTYPAVASSPYVPPQIIRKDIVGWNSGAVSGATSEGSADLAFELDAASVGAVIGLTQAEQVTGPEGIIAGFYFTMDRYGRPQFQFVEAGRSKGSAVRIDLGDTFRVTYVNGVVRYYYYDEKIRTASIEIEGAVRAGAGLYRSGDALPTSGYQPPAAGVVARIQTGGWFGTFAYRGYFDGKPLTALDTSPCFSEEFFDACDVATQVVITGIADLGPSTTSYEPEVGNTINGLAVGDPIPDAVLEEIIYVLPDVAYGYGSGSGGGPYYDGPYAFEGNYETEPPAVQENGYLVRYSVGGAEYYGLVFAGSFG